MQVKFKCKCGARLQCSSKGIGRFLACPGCSAKVEVPAPGELEVENTLRKVPHAYPCKSNSEYLALTQEIHANTAYNVEICGVTGHAGLAFDCVDRAKRMIRNIAIFLDDTEHKPVRQTALTTASVRALAFLAAGQDFGGNDSSDATDGQHRRWLNQQPKNDFDGYSETHPLRGQVLATLTALDALLT